MRTAGRPAPSARRTSRCRWPSRSPSALPSVPAPPARACARSMRSTNASLSPTYWISNLPTDIPAKDLVRLAKARWRIEHDYRELKTGLGLDHFEGRTFTGWHRHVLLVTAAHLFLTEQQTCPKAPARA
ncbi:transposase [Streptomyces sp. NBC_00576]|uniref:transposase n=1 Tax=Streptomyces sp. NBC_00576 TaxID=2903665 RepID=UPI002E808FE0|nr:transposase [Streptomyces sp. NBC_00576]WUB68768.1 transposase [Streptomyces sp. NBC_00576]